MDSARFFSSLRQFLFPYRTHLEREVEHWRTLHTQERRRVDELTQQLAELHRPSPPKEHRPLAPLKPNSWARVRQNNRQEEEAEQPTGLVPLEKLQ